MQPIVITGILATSSNALCPSCTSQFKNFATQLPKPTDDLAMRLYQRDDGKWVWRFDPNLFSPANRKRWAEEAPKRWTYYGRISCPVLEVRGALSDLVSDAIVDRMKTINPLTQCIDAADAGHNVIADQPSYFAEVALAFLRDK